MKRDNEKNFTSLLIKTIFNPIKLLQYMYVQTAKSIERIEK